MGHAQSKSEVEVIYYNRETWTLIHQMSVAKMNYNEAMTFNQRFLERWRYQFGVNGEITRRKAEHQALSRRLNARANVRVRQP